MRAHPWGAWLILVVGSFAVLEREALARHRWIPLSAYLRQLMGLHPRRRDGAITPILAGAGAVWLIVHLVRDGSP